MAFNGTPRIGHNEQSGEGSWVIWSYRCWGAFRRILEHSYHSYIYSLAKQAQDLNAACLQKTPFPPPFCLQGWHGDNSEQNVLRLVTCRPSSRRVDRSRVRVKSEAGWAQRGAAVNILSARLSPVGRRQSYVRKKMPHWRKTSAFKLTDGLRVHTCKSTAACTVTNKQALFYKASAVGLLAPSGVLWWNHHKFCFIALEMMATQSSHCARLAYSYSVLRFFFPLFFGVKTSISLFTKSFSCKPSCAKTTTCRSSL